MPDDATAMWEIGQRSPTAPRWSKDQYRELFETRAELRRLVLISEGVKAHRREPFAFLIASQVGPDWELESIVVDSAKSRKGLGTMLLRSLIYEVARGGGGSILLEVRASNTAARSLYEKCEFTADGVRKAYYSSPSEDAILYRRAIPRSVSP